MNGYDQFFRPLRQVFVERDGRFVVPADYGTPQTDIPDDLKADADLPLDAISALAAMRFQLTLTLAALDDLIEAVERI